MKRNSKILAFVIAFAMVMSMVVIPASAAADVMTDADYVAPTGVNLLDEWGLNYNYDSTKTATTGLYGWNGTTTDENADSGKRLSGRDPSITKNAGTMTNKSGIGVDGTKGGYANLGATGKQARINYLPFDNEPGTVYKMTVDVKIANETIAEGGTPITSDTLSWSAEGTTNSKNKVTAISSSGLTVNNTDYTTVTYIFETTANKETDYDRNHAHIGVKTKNATELYVDNWTLTKIAETTATAETIANTKSVKFTFNNDVTVTAANFAVSPATAAVSVTGSGKEYTVTLSDYAYGTTYTITTQNVNDAYGRTMATNASATVVTEVQETPLSANILAARNKDYDFENSEAGATSGVIDGPAVSTSNTFGNTSYVVVDSTTTAAQSGEQCLKVTTEMSALNDSYNGCVRFNGLNAPFAIGKYYEISYWAKLADDETAAVTAQVHWSRQGSSGMTTTGSKSNNVTLTNEWQRVTGYVTFVTQTEASTANAGKAHLGVWLGTESAITKGVYIDNIQVRELVSLVNEPAVYAATSVDGTDTYVDVMTTGETASSVYIIAAKYTGDTLTDVKLVPVTATNTESVNPAKFANLTDDYKIFIWDTSLKPLCSVFTAGNIQ